MRDPLTHFRIEWIGKKQVFKPLLQLKWPQKKLKSGKSRNSQSELMSSSPPKQRKPTKMEGAASKSSAVLASWGPGPRYQNHCWVYSSSWAKIWAKMCMFQRPVDAFTLPGALPAADSTFRQTATDSMMEARETTASGSLTWLKPMIF